MSVGYKVWCGDWTVAKLLLDRLVNNGFSWRPEALQDNSIAIYFGDQGKQITYTNGFESRQYFNDEPLEEIAFNAVTDEFIRGVYEGLRISQHCSATVPV